MQINYLIYQKSQVNDISLEHFFSFLIAFIPVFQSTIKFFNGARQSQNAI